MDENEIYEQRRLRECFSSDSGQAALGLLLLDSGYYDDNLAPEDVAVENFMKRILKKMGINTTDNVRQMIRHMMELPITQGVNDGKEES